MLANNIKNATIEQNDRMIDFEKSRDLSYIEIISVLKGLDVISEFYDVHASVTTLGSGICAVSLGKTLEEAVKNTMDSNPIDFINSTIVVSTEVDSEIAKMFKNTNIIVAPKFTKNAIELLERHDVCYITIKTPLKEYKKYLSENRLETPLGTIIVGPNLSELNKDSFKVVSKLKPTVEQIEDAVFAWKVAKHAYSQAVVIAKDLKTAAIRQGLQSASVEYALDYSCDMSKEAILASDMSITTHDINVASQGRIGLVIVPEAAKEVIALADKYNMALIVTGFRNILY